MKNYCRKGESTFVQSPILTAIIIAMLLFILIAGGVVTIYVVVTMHFQKRETINDQRKRQNEHEKWLVEAKARGFQEPRNDAERYRDFIRSMAWSPPEHRVPYEPDEFYKWLEAAYEETSNDTKFSVSTAMFAIGLMTFGRLDMIDVAVENMAPVSSQGQVSRIPPMFFVRLLPLPESLSDSREIRRDKEPLRSWLRDNKSRLRWDEEQGKFILMDSLDDCNDPLHWT